MEAINPHYTKVVDIIYNNVALIDKIFDPILSSILQYNSRFWIKKTSLVNRLVW